MSRRNRISIGARRVLGGSNSESIAQNVALDPIFAKHAAILETKLKVLNSALSGVTAEQRQRFAAKLLEKEKREGRKSITDADRR
ncbi:MAG TPA: hypothetical protein VG498_04690, partial [Terriglobales bacterium]|nr:hypothetical protein [Terriglobales bacterium]